MGNNKSYRSLLWVNITFLVIFSFIFISRRNFEFLIYMVVIIFFALVIWISRNKVDYPLTVLWGLTFWGLLNMIGGGLYLNGQKIYHLMLWPIVGEPYNILKYDQFVHFFGFGVATLVMFYLIKPYLANDKVGKIVLSIIIVMAGLGVGALNEIIEFIITIIIPDNGVGGYENTALDLVSNLLGAIVAMVYILKKETSVKWI